MKSFKTPQRILVIPLRFIGDGVLTVPLLRQLKHHYPEAQLDILLPQSMVNLYEPCPYIDQIITGLSSPYRLITTLQQGRYDLGILLRRSVSNALMLKLAGVQHLIGFDHQRFPPPLNFKRWGWFLDETRMFPPLNTTTPQVKTYLSLLPQSLNAVFTDTDNHLELWTTPQDEAKAHTLWTTHQLDKASTVAVVHVTSASKEKALDLNLFVPSLQRLASQNIRLVALGTASDHAIYEQLQNLAQVPLLNLCGQTTLRETLAFFKNIQLLLSLDSAPIHLATAMRVPHIIAIYGSTSHQQWQPYPYNGMFTPVYNEQLDCCPCEWNVCAHNKCRTELGSDRILRAVERHLPHLPLSPSRLQPVL